MGRLFAGLLIVAGCALAWYSVQHGELPALRQWGLVSGRQAERALPAPSPDQESIRIASFNLTRFEPEQADNPAILEVVCRVIREFDIVALQQVTSPRPDVLRKLLDQVNATGRHYSLLVGPAVGRGARQQRFVYVFDQVTIETDRSACYTVDDPDDLLRYPPLVGWFRVRGPAADKAFTFTLVNVLTDPDDRAFELNQLDSVYYKVRDDWRGEDDLIMLGDFQADDRHLGELSRIPQLLAALSDATTNTQQTQQQENLLFQLSATSEYAGRAGVFDFMREYNLTLDQATQVSEHLVVWAEFSCQEGGGHPAVAFAPGGPSSADVSCLTTSWWVRKNACGESFHAHVLYPLRSALFHHRRPVGRHGSLSALPR